MPVSLTVRNSGSPPLIKPLYKSSSLSHHDDRESRHDSSQVTQADGLASHIQNHAVNLAHLKNHAAVMFSKSSAAATNATTIAMSSFLPPSLMRSNSAMYPLAYGEAIFLSSEL